MSESPFRRPPPSGMTADTWMEPRRSPFVRSKNRPKGDRNSISLDYSLNRDDLSSGVSSGVDAATAILADPFDADWAALAMRQPISSQRHAFQEENAFKSFELNM